MQQQQQGEKQPKQPKQGKGGKQQGGGKKGGGAESTSSDADIRKLRIQKAEVGLLGGGCRGVASLDCWLLKARSHLFD